ncbi:hypothetical protein ACFWNT_31845 [Streptomyces sp. NPDC058409]|uniref:hypothetical protein n=1 Tax=Streptomyces sp. NPDC058409 TaxID=3346484 RepID=UPI00364D498A
MRDLHPDRAELPGAATVVDLSTPLSSGAVFVITAEHGVFLTPGSRLVLVHCSTSSAGPPEPNPHLRTRPRTGLNHREKQKKTDDRT